MATDFQLIKTIDQQTKDIVFGYIRQTQLLIAPLIQNLCLLYYMEREYFAICGDCIEFDDEKCTAVSVIEADRCMYGNVEVVVNQTYPMLFRWVFEITQNDQGNTAIGICSTTKWLNRWFQHAVRLESDDTFYALGYRCKMKKRNTTKIDMRIFQNGDVIKMELNTLKKTLTFTLNEDESTTVFEKIDMSKTYRMAVAMHGENASVKLMKFHQTSIR